MTKIQPQILKGFRDFLPDQMVIRQKVIDILRGVFESYGYEPLETPALEYAETLLGKSGKEAEKLMYLFKDSGGRAVGLRYELTVSLARVMAQYSNLPLPFRRYQMQPVWRAEKPQRGRYREFWQCDVDIIGTTSPLADAEIIEIAYRSLIALGFKKFLIKINSREILFKLLEEAGILQEKQASTLIAIDKLERIGQEGVAKELVAKGLTNQTIAKIFTLINQTKPDETLKQVFRILQLNKVPSEYYQFTPTLVRGLEYYTGPIFESFVYEPKIGSLCGGGRWDKLIGKFTGKDLPATGITVGLERIVDVIKELNLWPDIKPTKTQVLVTIFSPEYLEKSIKVASLLRSRIKVNTELYPDPEAKLDKQLKYADKKGIPWVVIIGPEEVNNNSLTIKDLKNRKQESISQNKLQTYFNQLK